MCYRQGKYDQTKYVRNNKQLAGHYNKTNPAAEPGKPLRYAGDCLGYHHLGFIHFDEKVDEKVQ